MCAAVVLTCFISSSCIILNTFGIKFYYISIAHCFSNKLIKILCMYADIIVKVVVP